MQSIAFFNNKGGVGKTTLLCNVAAFMAIRKGKRVLVVDADPKCNTTQLMLDEAEVFELYDNPKSFTIHSIIHPLSIGKGYSETLEPIVVLDYGVDLIPGDPRLALKEDLLSKDWQFVTPQYKPSEIHKAIFNLDCRIVVSLNFDKIYETYAIQASENTVVVKKLL